MEPNPRIRIREHEEVYPPADDSYLLLESVDLEGARTFLDVGTGTGIIALHAARECRTVATDVNPWAVKLCRKNARLNDLAVEVVRADLFRGLAGSFDVIAFNPPYLPLEPEGWAERAWSGGRQDDVILRFLQEARGHLSPGGRIYLLLSSHNGAALREARRRYRCTLVAGRKLFFEEIAVYVMRPEGGSHNV